MSGRGGRKNSRKKYSPWVAGTEPTQKKAPLQNVTFETTGPIPDTHKPASIWANNDENDDSASCADSTLKLVLPVATIPGNILVRFRVGMPESPCYFPMRLLHPESERKLTKVESEMRDYYDSTPMKDPFVTSFQVVEGDYYAAEVIMPGRDKLKWLRVRVVDTYFKSGREDRQVSVAFVDHGYTEDVEVCMMRPLEPRFLKALPSMGFLGALAGGPYEWNELQITTFKQNLHGHVVEAIVSSMEKGKSFTTVYGVFVRVIEGQPDAFVYNLML